MLLLIHILGAVFMAFLLLFTWVKIIKSSTSNFNFDKNALSVGLCAQSLTGLGLTIGSSSTVLQTCTRFGLYISLVALTFFAIKKSSNEPPVRIAAFSAESISLFFSIVLFITAVGVSA